MKPRTYTNAQGQEIATCRGRCWFTYYGWVGSSSPVCRHCKRPNPHYRPNDDIRSN